LTTITYHWCELRALHCQGADSTGVYLFLPNFAGLAVTSHGSVIRDLLQRNAGCVQNMKSALQPLKVAKIKTHCFTHLPGTPVSAQLTCSQTQQNTATYPVSRSQVHHAPSPPSTHSLSPATSLISSDIGQVVHPVRRCWQSVGVGLLEAGLPAEPAHARLQHDLPFPLAHLPAPTGGKGKEGGGSPCGKLASKRKSLP
jgi:hypothetical protein